MIAILAMHTIIVHRKQKNYDNSFFCSTYVRRLDNYTDNGSYVVMNFNDPKFRSTPSTQLSNEGWSLAFQTLIFSKHLNYADTLFGGQLLSWIDEASAMYAMEHMRTRRILTKKISEVVFINPALQGDFIQFWCRPTRDGNTSMTMELLVQTRNVDNHRQREICRCEIVYVAVDELGRPTVWSDA